MNKKLIILLCFIFLTTGLFATNFLPRSFIHKKNPLPDASLTKADSSHKFDALHYTINLQLFPDNESIQGNVESQLELTALEVDSISFELEQLHVDSVFVDGIETDFSYDSSIINVRIPPGYEMGDTVWTNVYYHGFPVLSSDGYGTGIHWQNYIYTYADPNGARYWWPGYDHPWDKATTSMNVTVPDGNLAASNGILVEEIDNPDETITFCWQNTDPIATYLISLCVGNYLTFDQTYEDIPIKNYVYPGHLSFAQNDFSCIPTAMTIFEDIYGEYPFQKYGQAECGIFSGMGGMEHQTMTSIGSGLITGNGTYEMIFVHELAHQWFGDCLTPLTWKDVWLSEGFAVYSEVLYVENTEGYQAMCDYVQSSLHSYYLTWAGTTPYCTYDPPYSEYFTPATYEKPASVLHMLRLRVGDEDFFEILNTYFNQYKNGTVITQDFINIVETVSGMNMEDFFAGWIYGSGIPSIEYYYLRNVNSEDSQILFRTKTVSPTASQFEMTIPFVASDGDITDTILVNTDYEYQTSQHNTSFADTAQITVEYDLDNWILDRGDSEIIPELQSALPGDNMVFLDWKEFSDETLTSNWNYSIFRKLSTENSYTKITEVSDTTSYIDETVQNWETYDYVITANYIDGADNWQSMFSNELTVTPQLFPMDQGILLVDETKDGSGTPISPTNAQVDSFYSDVLGFGNYDDYDYSSEGSPDLAILADYSTVIWCDDDFDEKNISQEADKLAALVMNGGHVAISGWKTADYIPDSFYSNLIGKTSTEIIADVDFLGANSYNHPFTPIDVNGDILPSWQDKWGYIATFSETDLQTDNILYRFDSYSGNYSDQPVGLINFNPEFDFNTIVLGFPLYFMEKSDVTNYYQMVYNYFYPIPGVDDPPIEEKIVLKNAPNPFSENTKIIFQAKVSNLNTISLKIYNIKGQLIRKVSDDETAFDKDDSNYSFVWNGCDKNDNKQASGLYFYQLIKDNKVLTTKKMLLLR
ncbi:MAG: T9SS type A sorting domain-containing protein [Candidatus Cloacimonetes bacterium]|nr:T9SS type A sorting domain-containing protein [Candidatus Cloacimonadota bacterium]